MVMLNSAFSLPLLPRAQEKIFYNTKIFKGDRLHPFAEAIAYASDGNVVWIHH